MYWPVNQNNEIKQANGSWEFSVDPKQRADVSHYAMSFESMMIKNTVNAGLHVFSQYTLTLFPFITPSPLVFFCARNLKLQSK